MSGGMVLRSETNIKTTKTIMQTNNCGRPSSKIVKHIMTKFTFLTYNVHEGDMVM